MKISQNSVEMVLMKISQNSVEMILMRFHKTQEEWNKAGTFGVLVTLRRMNHVKNAAEGLRGLSWRTDYD